jgi:peptidoglycan/xylan/chitin deacetylase (PgdA/CDA1 family)
MTSSGRFAEMSKALIINYHYCRAPKAEQKSRGITPDTFDRQMGSIAERFTPVHVDNFPLTRQDTADGAGCLVTFDDGTRDVFDNALPLIAQHRMAAVVFCCSQPYLENRVLNVQKTHLLQESWGWDGFRVRFMAALEEDPEGAEREDTSGLGLDLMYRYDAASTAAFKRLVNVELPYRVVNRLLDRLFEAEYGSQRDAVRHLYMSLDDVRRCADDGIGIGVHTHSHCMLSRLSPEEQEQEIGLPLELFRDTLGVPVHFLSYPYGIRGAWNDTTKTIARTRGLRGAFTLGRSVYDAAHDIDPFEMPRFDVNDVFTADGAVKIAT